MNARHMEAGRKRLASRMPLAWPALFAAVVFLLAALRIASGQAGGRRPGEVFQDCSVCPQMIVVPAGRFMMGSPESEKYRHDEEGPVREVTIPRAFAVGVYEVTNGEFRECVNEGSCGSSFSFVGTRRHALYSRSWDTAQLYVQWLSARTGAEYRLLSEAEWEYAARAGTTTRYSFGDDIAPGDANYDGRLYHYLDNDYIEGWRNDYKRYPTVGSYAPNGFGLYDMHGGVAEWVQDCWNDNYAGAPNDGSAWEAGDCRRRVIRGGSALDSPMELRSAARSWFQPGRRNDLIALRVARTLAP